MQTWNASYTGQNIWPAQLNTSRGAGVGYRRTQYGAAGISLSFQGTGFYLCFTANGAQHTLTLDGSAIRDDSGFLPARDDGGPCAGFGAETAFASSNLEAGTHSVLFSVSAENDREFRFFGGVITLDVNTSGQGIDANTIIDDQDPAWEFNPGGRVSAGGTWDTTHEPTYYSKLYESAGTFQCNYRPDATASYQFSGAGGIVLRGPLWFDSHSFSITLDQTTYHMDGTTSWQDGSNVLLAVGNLDPDAVHSLVVFDYSSTDQQCGIDKYCCVGIDSLVLLRPGSNAILEPTTAEEPPSTATADEPPATNGVAFPSRGRSSSSTSRVGAIAGGVLGGLAVAVGTVLFFAILRARRKERAARILAIASDTSPYTIQARSAATDPSSTSFHQATGSLPVGGHAEDHPHPKHSIRSESRWTISHSPRTTTPRRNIRASDPVDCRTIRAGNLSAKTSGIFKSFYLNDLSQVAFTSNAMYNGAHEPLVVQFQACQSLGLTLGRLFVPSERRCVGVTNTSKKTAPYYTTLVKCGTEASQRFKLAGEAIYWAASFPNSVSPSDFPLSPILRRSSTMPSSARDPETKNMCTPYVNSAMLSAFAGKAVKMVVRVQQVCFDARYECGV
ncbi:hypothetical protein AURDEDRAFT_128214 [Auricularia subglabra TFB-10046 SS5]|uniref:Uncharacterized protein n=1 Tax=Auricularia subglabra (strain TFB-10046 / SS5) TaxID=717982 RepID=J0WW09_AURST|nr:hypothetical protein AURDEDRAFT_128214 [Auricularia subglabra TFB-10046 SS5]